MLSLNSKFITQNSKLKRLASLIKSDGREKLVPPMAGLGRWKH
jgi:hypothetical protein